MIQTGQVVWQVVWCWCAFVKETFFDRKIFQANIIGWATTLNIMVPEKDKYICISWQKIDWFYPMTNDCLHLLRNSAVSSVKMCFCVFFNCLHVFTYLLWEMITKNVFDFCICKYLQEMINQLWFQLDRFLFNSYIHLLLVMGNLNQAWIIVTIIINQL